MRELPPALGEKLGVAAQVFADRGFDAARIDDVATATGIPKATLYYYFRGKEDILAHLLAQMLEAVRDSVKRTVSDPGSPADRLAGVIRAQLGVMASNPATCRVLVAELGRAGRIPEVVEALDEAFHAPVRALLVEGAQDGSLRQLSDVGAAAAAVFGALTAAGIHELAVSGALDGDRLAARLLPLLLEGMGAPASPPAPGRA